MPNVLRAKCIVAGESTVGKTAVTQVFASNGATFPKNYLMTRVLELNVKSVNIPDTNDVVELYILDSSGRDIFTETLLKCWKEPNLILLVCDVTNESSLKECNKWSKLAKLSLGAENGNLPGVLLANKIDLQQSRVWSPKAGEDVAQKLGLQYFECCAKEVQGVEEPFFYLANEWHKMYLEKHQNE